MSGPKRKGKEFNCQICNKVFYRSPAQIANGSFKHCSKACLGQAMMGSWHPFKGRRHSENSKKKISANRKGQCLGNQNAKGYRHTKEARQKITEASRKLWAEKRDKMLESLPRGPANHAWRDTVRYIREFTPRQKREWRKDKCEWCGSTDTLQLDHILPVWFCDLRIQENSQTLCQKCNLWKRDFIETPMYFARQAAKGTKL